MLLIWELGQGYRKFGNGTVVYLGSAEPVRQIHFGKVDMAKSGVGMPDLVEDSLQSATKLHCFSGSQRNGVQVDIVEGQIHYESWSTVALGYHSHGRNSEANKVTQLLQFANYPVGEHNPETLEGKVQELFSEEGQMVETRLVASTTDAFVESSVGPRGAGHESRGSLCL